MSVAKDTERAKGYVVNRGYQVLFAPIGMSIEMVRGWVEAEADSSAETAKKGYSVDD